MDTDDAGCDDEETNNKLRHREDLKMADTKILNHRLDAGIQRIAFALLFLKMHFHL